MPARPSFEVLSNQKISWFNSGCSFFSTKLGNHFDRKTYGTLNDGKMLCEIERRGKGDRGLQKMHRFRPWRFRERLQGKIRLSLWGVGKYRHGHLILLRCNLYDDTKKIKKTVFLIATQKNMWKIVFNARRDSKILRCFSDNWAIGFVRIPFRKGWLRLFDIFRPRSCSKLRSRDRLTWERSQKGKHTGRRVSQLNQRFFPKAMKIRQIWINSHWL